MERVAEKLGDLNIGLPKKCLRGTDIVIGKR